MKSLVLSLKNDLRPVDLEGYNEVRMVCLNDDLNKITSGRGN